MGKISKLTIIVVSCAVIAVGFALIALNHLGMFTVERCVSWSLYVFLILFLAACVLLSHKVIEGKIQEIVFFLSTTLLIANFAASILFCFVYSNFDFSSLNWADTYYQILIFNPTFLLIVFLFFIGGFALYCGFIDRNMIKVLSYGGLRGKGNLKRLEANLENSRWMTKEERDKIFKRYKYSALGSVKKDGIPVMASLTNKDKDMDVVFNSPCHSIVIGSTGSGKTTTFVSPMIQLLASTAAGSSMVITDPKGELFSLHSQFLQSRGYDVKVVDLRDTYSSYRWNPLESIWDTYQKYANAHDLAHVRKGNVKNTKYKIVGDPETFNKKEWYEFNGNAVATYDELLKLVKIYRKKMYDEVYEDLNDLVTILVPVENEKDPMWEKGARSITLAVLLAMLEDSENPELGMTKEKFNFFNMTKILQNSAKDYTELRNYFAGRSSLSRALALSKQVCDAAENTRSSYMSVLYDKLTLFNDAGICALTSASDFTREQLAEKPTALFLKIPDEKDTRHNLAAIFILNIYKTLIKVASATEELTLPRNVYFIMDEFGNMPKIEKFDKFITVGRSRKIWFTMIIQSYAQLNNVYGDRVADIVKGNCGIKMFIGSNDMNTCKEYSELCGNITVVTTSTSGSTQGTDVNVSAQTQVRPLIYPSDLQRLNHPGDIGHSIIVTFGNYPLKTYFSPSFKVPFYKTGKMDTSETERYFDEKKKVFYDIKARNVATFAKKDEAPPETQAEEKKEEKAEEQTATTTETATETSEEEKMVAAFRDWLKEHEGGSFIDFCYETCKKEGKE
ncbi:MAG: type IV secretory system conjugative DNA transfer family protein [Clostridia bacterium]|nr:type IV secretory system conjugative DNA transfer family protein [Clostridia bacterium]